MRVCRVKSTGRIIEAQSHATAGTLVANAATAGYKPDDVEESVITDSQFRLQIAAQDEAEKSNKQKMSDLETKFPVTQRFLREALMFVASKNPEIKSSPGYIKIADGEAKIKALR
jgi:hypothetical protein